MKQFKSGDAVKFLNVDGKRILDRFNGLTGIYCGEDIFGGHLVKVVYSGEPIIIAVDDVEPIGKTLLEILVDELPKRGGWRDGASVCIQDSCKAIKFNSRHSTLTMNEFGNWESKSDAFNNYGWVGTNLLGVSELATDHATKIVTREEYEQAAKPNRFEQSVKAANDLALVMLENMAQRLADACAQSEEGKRPIIKEEQGNTFTWRGICANAYTFDPLTVPTSKAAALNNMLKKNRIIDDEAVKACAGAEAAELKVKKSIENFSKESALWCFLPDPLHGIFDASAHTEEKESKLERIERIRKARDEALRDYNDVFVSGDSELRKLKLGDEVVFEDGKSTWLLIEIQERGSMGRNVRVCTFSNNINRRELKVSSNTPFIRFAKVS